MDELATVPVQPVQVTKDERFEMFVVTIDGKELEPQNHAAASERVREALCNIPQGNSAVGRPTVIVVEKVIVRDVRSIVQRGGVWLGVGEGSERE